MTNVIHTQFSYNAVIYHGPHQPHDFLQNFRKKISTWTILGKYHDFCQIPPPPPPPPPTKLLVGGGGYIGFTPKGLRASPKNYYGNTTPSMAWSHHWRNVWRNIAGSRPNWAQDFTRTSQKNSRSSQKNYYQHSRNFGTSYFCLSYLLHKQAYVQLDEVTPVAGGLTLHSCYCN